VSKCRVTECWRQYIVTTGFKGLIGSDPCCSSPTWDRVMFLLHRTLMTYAGNMAASVPETEFVQWFKLARTFSQPSYRNYKRRWTGCIASTSVWARSRHLPAGQRLRHEEKATGSVTVLCAKKKANVVCSEFLIQNSVTTGIALHVMITGRFLSTLSIRNK
jgi:hypothetical protein